MATLCKAGRETGRAQAGGSGIVSDFQERRARKLSQSRQLLEDTPCMGTHAIGAHLAGPGRIPAGLGWRLRDLEAAAGTACRETEHDKASSRA